jgi:hypothetical protein
MPTVVIGNNTGDDYSGFHDNRLDSGLVDYNHGAHTCGYIGAQSSGRTMREIQRWLLDDITAGATCDGATLYLYDTDWGNRNADCAISIYRIADANGSWVEGTSLGDSQSGSSCWNYRAYNTNTWAGSAGLSTAGTDYVNTVIGSATFTDGTSGYRTITLNSSGLTVLADWFGDASNNGVMLIGSGSNDYWTEIISSNGTDGSRPYLSVTYTASGGATVNDQYFRRQRAS